MKNIFVMGSINMDLVIETDVFPLKGETVVGKNFITNGGGKGANQAVAIAKQGINPYLLAAIGKDVFGIDICKSLTGYGVNTQHIVQINDVSTGIASIIINNSDNRIILDLGANHKLRLADYKSVIDDKGREGDIFVTQMETSIDNVVEAIVYAKSRNLTVVLNPAPVDGNFPLEVLEYVDYLIPNETELSTLAKMSTNSLIEIQNACKCLHSKKIKCIIVTMGQEGSLVSCDNEFTLIPPRKVCAVDTTAAGDTFVGNVCVGLSHGYSLIECCVRASVASSITVTRRGAQQSIPTKEEVDELM